MVRRARGNKRVGGPGKRASHGGVLARVRTATIAFAVKITEGPALPSIVVGSGVIVDDTGIALTATHVIEQLDEEVERRSRKGATATKVAFVSAQAEISGERKLLIPMYEAGIDKSVCHKEVDLAAVVLDSRAPGYHALEPEYDSPPREGEPVATCGWPYGTEIHEANFPLSSFLQGTVSAIVPHPMLPPEARPYYLLQMPVNPGNSGGAVFSLKTGRVHGIVRSRLEDALGRPTGLSKMVPIHLAREMIPAAREFRDAGKRSTSYPC